MCYKSIDKQYSHCEIESSLILSALTLNIPFPEHSQAPRNVFSSQQTKQANFAFSIGVELLKNSFSINNKYFKSFRNSFIKTLNKSSFAKNILLDIADKGLRF